MCLKSLTDFGGDQMDKSTPHATQKENEDPMPNLVQRVIVMIQVDQNDNADRYDNACHESQDLKKRPIKSDP